MVAKTEITEEVCIKAKQIADAVAHDAIIDGEDEVILAAFRVASVAAHKFDRTREEYLQECAEAWDKIVGNHKGHGELLRLVPNV